MLVQTFFLERAVRVFSRIGSPAHHRLQIGPTEGTPKALWIQACYGSVCKSVLSNVARNMIGVARQTTCAQDNAVLIMAQV
jgi:hypothetical protein